MPFTGTDLPDSFRRYAHALQRIATTIRATPPKMSAGLPFGAPT